MDAPTGEIMKIVEAAIAAALILVTATAAGQDPKAGDARGELLYSTYCIGCHTTQLHWREKRLATDWSSLESQVRRWHETVGLAPDEEGVAAITRYLNARYYHFATPATMQQGNASGAIAVQCVDGPPREILESRCAENSRVR